MDTFQIKQLAEPSMTVTRSCVCEGEGREGGRERREGGRGGREMKQGRREGEGGRKRSLYTLT